jgi:glutathione S-transferase
MKLYFSQGTCSLHPQIALREAGLPFEMVRVELSSHKLAKDGSDFNAINPKGYTPLLELDDGTRLSEGPIIAQYIADRNPKSTILPPAGTFARVRVQEWLHFLGTEIHRGLSPLFNPNLAAEDRATHSKRVGARFDYIAKELGSQPLLTGETFTLADGYLYNLLRWTVVYPVLGIDLARWPTLKAYFARVEERPSVRAALEAEKATN